MNIYSLSRPVADLAGRGEQARVVLLADNEDDARTIASQGAGNEGREMWLHDAEVELLGFAADDIATTGARLLCQEFHGA